MTYMTAWSLFDSQVSHLKIDAMKKSIMRGVF